MPITADGNVIHLPPEVLTYICEHHRDLGLDLMLVGVGHGDRAPLVYRYVEDAILQSRVRPWRRRWGRIRLRFPRGWLGVPVERTRPRHWVAGGKRSLKLRSPFRLPRRGARWRGRSNKELEYTIKPGATQATVDWFGPLDPAAIQKSRTFRLGGVYVFSRNGTPVYVGMASNLRARLLAHFAAMDRWCPGTRAAYRLHVGIVKPAAGEAPSNLDEHRRLVEATLVAQLLRARQPLRNRDHIIRGINPNRQRSVQVQHRRRLPPFLTRLPNMPTFALPTGHGLTTP
jgi:hypothetical protein